MCFELVGTELIWAVINHYVCHRLIHTKSQTEKQQHTKSNWNQPNGSSGIHKSHDVSWSLRKKWIQYPNPSKLSKSHFAEESFGHTSGFETAKALHESRLIPNFVACTSTTLSAVLSELNSCLVRWRQSNPLLGVLSKFLLYHASTTCPGMTHQICIINTWCNGNGTV